jgi:hypothetical protein
MNRAKLGLGLILALLVVLGAAWYSGASGKWAAVSSLEAAELRSDLIEGRSRLLDARLDLYSVNFGNASRHLEGARDLLRAAGERLTALGREDEAKRLDTALLKIDEAQRMAGQLEQGANDRVAEAARTVEELLQSAER